MKKSSSPSLVVAIGASAGGVNALQRLLKDAGACTRMAFVVIQHKAEAGQLSYDYLVRISPLPVREIEAGASLVAGTVHVVPARSSVEVDEGQLKLAPARAAGQRLTVIDATFSSLGKYYGARTVGVVLSGEGNDGTAGLENLSAAGGLTIAQSADSAEHPSMPRSAVASGAADHVLAPEDIVPELLAYENYLERVLDKPGVPDLRESIAAGLIRICEVLHRATSLDFKHYKTTTLIRRIQRRMQVLQLTSVDAYVDRLSAQHEEAEALFGELLINVTSFFRDPEAFAALQSEVLNAGLEAVPKGERYRIWVAGCSTGEEVYTLAMLVREHLAQLSHPPEVQIIATDVDEAALAFARKGAYPLGIERHVSKERLERFFVKRNGKYHVEKSLRELCLFSTHNLINDPPFSQLDLISCRNVLIYFGTHLQRKLIPVFHYALKPGGHLFLGTSESLSTHRELFRPVSAKHRIAERKNTAIRPLNSFSTSVSLPAASLARENAGEREADLHMIGQRILLDEFAPRYVIVGDEGQIISVSAGISDYLEPSEGSFQNSVVKLVNPQLRMALRSVFSDARKHKRRVEHDAATMRTGSRIARVGIVVQPMPRLGEEGGLYMIVFKDLGSLHQVSEDSSDPKVSAMNAALIDQLEKELTSTREDLDKTVQDLEASNEELKSSNEELLSMNEELQSANEELEASKEEIQVANDALQRSNSDLENLLGSTQIATLFLDAELCIKGFTPAITEIYPIRAGDLGRRITELASPGGGLPPLPTLAALSETPAESELQLSSGAVYLRRVLPYRTAQGQADGFVVTFINITELKKAQSALKENTEQLRLALEAGQLGTFYWNIQTGEARWSEQAYRHFGYAQEKPSVSVERFYEAVHAEDRARVAELIERAVQNGKPFKAEFRTLGPDGRERWVQESGNVFRDEAGAPSHMLGAVQDISERKRAQIAFEKNLDLSPAILWITEEDGSCSYLSRQWYEHTGQTKEEALGFGWLKAVHPDDMPMAAAAFREASENRKPFYIEYRLRTKSGAYRWAIDAGNPRLDATGKFLGIAGTVFDIHDRILAEESRRESERRFQAMADSAPVLIWISGSDRQRTWFNKGWLEYTGLAPERSLGQGWLSCVHPEDQDRYLELYNDSFDKRVPFQIEYRLRHYSGQYRWISARGVPRFYSDGTLEGYVGACLDIDEVKLGQEAVRVSQERYRSLTEVIPQLVWTCLPSGECTYLSRQWVEYTGIPEKEQLGIEWISRVVHPEDRARTYEHWMGAVAGRHPYDIEYRLRRADGTYRWFKTRGKTIRDAQGEVEEWFGTCTDMTDEMRIRQELEAAIDTRDEFLSIASHELKTPVTSLRLQMQILAKQIRMGDKRAADPVHLNKVAELSIRQTKQLSKLIDDMLDVARIETGKLDLTLAIEDIGGLVRNCLETFLPHFRDAGVAVETNFEEGLFASCDAYRLEQVFINLFTNALKYGGGQPVRIAAFAEGQKIKVVVADHGRGIAEEHIGRIFGRFERAISANEVSGLGLGLYISKKIVESLKGDISVASRLGEGATFTVELAAAEAP